MRGSAVLWNGRRARILGGTDGRKNVEIEEKKRAVQTACSVIRENSAFYYRTFKASLSNIVFAVQDGMPPFRLLPPP